MRISASSNRPRHCSRRIVSWIFAAATSGYNIRLDFSDGDQLFLGPGSGAIEVAVRPPTFWQTLWIFLNPGLRTGESYVLGYWAVTQGDLATFLRIIQIPRTGLYARIYRRIRDWRGPIFFIRQHVLTEWNRRSAPAHYDFGDDLYNCMLDPAKQYSCAFFSLSGSEDLTTAQQTKVTTSIERLRLDQPRLKVLDIGCGWGALAAEIAHQPGDHYVFGITLSKEQLKSALARRAMLPAHVARRLEYCLADYRHFLAQPKARFDRVISIGMFEHVGLGRHAHFFRSVERSLTPDGRVLVHSVVRPSPGTYNEWIQRYVFPGSFLPSVAELVSAAESANLIVDAVYIHPPSDYRKTIRAWRQRFEAAWPELQRQNPEKHNEVIKRAWTFYLASMETIFTEDLMNFRIAQVELRKQPQPITSAE
jgi:cyclopropane-fatty-acyl-phospholipid synthase